MKVSYNWLSRYLTKMPSPQDAAEKLTLTGLEVEEVEQTGAQFDGIVVGKVLDVQPHPDADRLVVCKVDIGQEEPSQIVCGAPNVAAGQKVPVATVGSVLPAPLPDGSPFKIRKAKIRGQKSAGMICAEDELGLSDDHSGIMVLDDRYAPGTPFAHVTGSAPDFVFEIGLTPNRPDATCHLGVARDLAAVTGAALKKPLDELPEVTRQLDEETIRITDTDKCHRYAGIIMRGISIGESPQWLKKHLASIGLRPLNNVVDITNFVLHELGQPLHAFDLEKLAGAKIDVRSFPRATKFTTLDDVERTVPAGSLFICDGEKPVALAGVMGGINSEISEETTDLLIESAWFEPVGIRKTSRALGLQTDSSYRFERGVDPSITRDAALRCAELILELCGGTIEGISDVHPVKTEPLTVSLRYDRLGNLLGTSIAPKTVTGILNRLEFATREESSDPLVWKCTVPTFRPDVTTEIDLIEEVARIYDYNNIPDPERITIANPEPVPFGEQFREKVRQAAVSAGLKEIYTNSLLPERFMDALGGPDVVVPTLNPITKDQALLRTQLMYGFLRSAAYNFNRGTAGVRFFEIGNIFRRDSEGGTWIEGVHEATHLHMGVAGNIHTEHWKVPARPFDLFDLKALVESVLTRLGILDQTRWKKSGAHLDLIAEHAGDSGDTGDSGDAGNSGDSGGNSNETVIGTLFQVDETWKKYTEVESSAFSAELNIGVLEQIARQAAGSVYRPVSRFPSFEFDLALVADKQIAAGEMMSAMEQTAGTQLVNVEVFDVFEGGSLEKHQKSIAFRLTFQDNSKTLTIKDVDPVIQKILKKLGSMFSVELRS
ncbi:MAG: phenylalanine--tRNA ligase subunit beta [Balneolaceae bacterium]|nr:MAG: phenylalanine--tRNA ligase subunit beta [Balneolaceae bacterium]